MKQKDVTQEYMNTRYINQGQIEELIASKVVTISFTELDERTAYNILRILKGHATTKVKEPDSIVIELEE